VTTTNDDDSPIVAIDDHQMSFWIFHQLYDDSWKHRHCISLFIHDL